MSPPSSSNSRPRYRLLKTLEHSQREAVASSTMTATCDNYMNAFALHLGATSIQMGFLTAVPQLLGSLMQLVSVWLGTFLTRRMLVLLTAVLQAALMFGFAALAVQRSINLVPTLILLVILYQCASHLIQPQWRAWMGSLVPQKQRGVFFAARTRLTMATSLAVFLGGGLFLGAAAQRRDRVGVERVRDAGDAVAVEVGAGGVDVGADRRKGVDEVDLGERDRAVELEARSKAWVGFTKRTDLRIVDENTGGSTWMQKAIVGRCNPSVLDAEARE